MSKKKKKNREITEQTENVAESVAAEDTEQETDAGALTEPQQEQEASPAEEAVPKIHNETSQQDAEKPTHEEFVEHKITESEKTRLRERFRFDWELEENIIEALDEDASELTDPEEEAEPEPIQVRSVSMAQVAQTLFGLFVLVFSIIGVVATCFKISDVIKAQSDNSEQIAYFESFLMPLVASDTPTFDGAASLNEDVIITAACWDIIFNPSVYYEFSNGYYQVSYLDIDRRVTKLFGAGLTYTHKTVGDIEMSFEYNEETGMYLIPAYPRSPAYYSDITAITEVEGGLELTVCYRLPITNWIESVDSIEKTMIYTVVPSETDYNVVAIRIGEIGFNTEAN